MAVDYPYLVMIVCEEEKRFAARDDFVEAGAAKPGVCPPSHFSSHFERPPCFLPHSIFSTLDIPDIHEAFLWSSFAGRARLSMQRSMSSRRCEPALCPLVVHIPL